MDEEEERLAIKSKRESEESKRMQRKFCFTEQLNASELLVRFGISLLHSVFSLPSSSHPSFFLFLIHCFISKKKGVARERDWVKGETEADEEEERPIHINRYKRAAEMLGKKKSTRIERWIEETERLRDGERKKRTSECIHRHKQICWEKKGKTPVEDRSGMYSISGSIDSFFHHLSATRMSFSGYAVLTVLTPVLQEISGKRRRESTLLSTCRLLWLEKEEEEGADFFPFSLLIFFLQPLNHLLFRMLVKCCTGMLYTCVCSFLPRSLCFCCTSSSVEFDWERLEGISLVESWREREREVDSWKRHSIRWGQETVTACTPSWPSDVSRWGTSYYAVLSFLSSAISFSLLFSSLLFSVI